MGDDNGVDQIVVYDKDEPNGDDDGWERLRKYVREELELATDVPLNF